MTKTPLNYHETPEQRRERFVTEKGQYTLRHPDGTEITPEELAARPARPLGPSPGGDKGTGRAK